MELSNREPDKQASVIREQTKKSISLWIGAAIAVLLVGLLGFLLGRMAVNTTEQVVPTENIFPITTTPGSSVTKQPEPTNQFTATCPPGQYQYGIPLGCVPTTYQCDKKNGGCPICLSGKTTIATPDGAVNVKHITKGTRVWTLDRQRNRVAVQVVAISKRKVGKTHKILHIIFKDRRGVFVSAGHPLATGKNVEELRAGAIYDGSVVASITYEDYDEDYTYDFLPAGDTGYYFANDILMGSTIKR